MESIIKPIEQQRLWLSNFETLCPYLKYNKDKPVLELKEWLENPSKDRVEHGTSWETEKKFFGYPELIEIIDFYWKKIMWQPICYLNAIDQVPELLTDEDVKKRFDLIQVPIEHSKDKLCERYHSNLAYQIKEKIRINKTGAEQLFFEIILNHTNQLEEIGEINSLYHFNFKESPLFISLYEQLINKIKKHYAMINSNAKFTVFDEYIETIPELRKKFDMGNYITGFQSGLQPQQIERLESQLKESIYSDHISKFTKIESELFERGFIDSSHKWQKHKTDLADFLCVLINYKYFKPIVKGKTIKDFHKRQFISERYGYGKTGLSETWKKAKPQIQSAVIPFSWIEKPE